MTIPYLPEGNLTRVMRIVQPPDGGRLGDWPGLWKWVLGEPSTCEAARNLKWAAIDAE